MKVLHVNSSDNGGGAAIAAFRHHEAMKRKGIESKMLVFKKHSTRGDVLEFKSNACYKLLKRPLNKLFNLHYNFYASWSWNHFGHDISKSKEVIDADIIILHWINDYSVSLKSIERILKTGKQVYWFMHDMWAITGGCHHAFECEKYKDHCGKCFLMHNQKGSSQIKDISYLQFEEKLSSFRDYTNLKFITPSEWLYKKVIASKIGKNHNVFIARNILDTNLFSPRDKEYCRNKLRLPINRKLILFGADNINSPYKGWIYLKDALNCTHLDVECVVYGNSLESDLNDIKKNIYNMGRIDNIDNLIDLYSACDVFVTPSLADNYPNVLIEAMACGLVCVGFNTGGIPEIIKDGYNGAIVRRFSSQDLCNSIYDILNHKHYDLLSQNAINSIRLTNNYSNIIPLNI